MAADRDWEEREIYESDPEKEIACRAVEKKDFTISQELVLQPEILFEPDLEPTDEEIIRIFLENRFNKERDSAFDRMINRIVVVPDFYERTPQQLAEAAVAHGSTGKSTWYFYVKKVRMKKENLWSSWYARRGNVGLWVVQNVSGDPDGVKIMHNSKTIGVKKFFRFKEKMTGRSKKTFTDWVMEEFDYKAEKEWLFCKLYQRDINDATWPPKQPDSNRGGDGDADDVPNPK